MFIDSPSLDLKESLVFFRVRYEWSDRSLCATPHSGLVYCTSLQLSLPVPAQTVNLPRRYSLDMGGSCGGSVVVLRRAEICQQGGRGGDSRYFVVIPELGEDLRGRRCDATDEMDGLGGCGGYDVYITLGHSDRHSWRGGLKSADMTEYQRTS